MPSGLDGLYRDVILDHYRAPRGSAPLTRPDVTEEGHNPLCGDEVVLELAVEGERVADISVRCRGCSISVASGSLLTERLRGLTFAEVRRVSAAFKELLQGESAPAEETLGELVALRGVRDFPVRIKCALLPWTTLDQALQQVHRGLSKGP